MDYEDSVKFLLNTRQYHINQCNILHNKITSLNIKKFITLLDDLIEYVLSIKPEINVYNYGSFMYFDIIINNDKYEVKMTSECLAIKYNNGITNLDKSNIKSFTTVTTVYDDDKIIKILCILALHMKCLVPYISINIDNVKLFFLPEIYNGL